MNDNSNILKSAAARILSNIIKIINRKLDNIEKSNVIRIIFNKIKNYDLTSIPIINIVNMTTIEILNEYDFDIIQNNNKSIDNYIFYNNINQNNNNNIIDRPQYQNRIDNTPLSQSSTDYKHKTYEQMLEERRFEMDLRNKRPSTPDFLLDKNIKNKINNNNTNYINTQGNLNEQSSIQLNNNESVELK